MRHTKSGLLVAFAVACVWLTAARAQNSPPILPGTPAADRTVSGRVVANGAEDTPVPRAQVTLTQLQAAGAPPFPLLANPVRRVTLTDADGKFEFRALPAGKFSVTVQPVNGIRSARSRIDVVDLDTQPSVTIVLPVIRTGAIAGVVRDPAGQPVARARVQAVARQTVVGYGRGQPSSGAAFTDERGIFRIFDLGAGAYYLSAWYMGLQATPGVQVETGPTSRHGFRTTYYPSSPGPTGAGIITVQPGEDAGGIEIRLIPAPAARVSFVVRDATGRPFDTTAIGPESVRRAEFTVIRRDDPFAAIFPYPSAPGRFTAAGLALGDYIALATIYERNAAGAMLPREAAWRPITVAGDMDDVQVRTNTGATVRGRVVLAEPPEPLAGSRGVIPPVNFAALSVTARVRGPGTAASNTIGIGRTTSPRADGSFELTGVRGEIHLVVTGQSGVLRSVRRGQQDITVSGLDLTGDETIGDVEIVVTTRTADVRGTVVLNNEARRAGGWVVAFPEEPTLCFKGSPFVSWVSLIGPFPPANLPPSRASAPDTAEFHLGRLAPGRYLLAAVASDPEGMPPTAPALLDGYRRGAKVVDLKPGSTAVVQLTLVGKHD